MKRLNITKEQFEKSKYFKNKYGALEYVSESGKAFKTSKGKVLMFVKESIVDDEQKWNDELWDCIITVVQSLGDEISSALIDADGNPTYDFVAAVKVARNAVSQEIADEVGEDITFTNELSQFVTPQEYASRIVDYVLENRPTKSIARVLKNKRSKYAESSKKFGRKFVKESADQTLEDIIDNIVELSIFQRDAESAETMFQDLKQELYNMGLFNGYIEEDFDDFHDDAIDYAKHHNFNKQIVERDAVTLKSDIEWGLSGNEVRESTRKSGRKFVKESTGEFVEVSAIVKGRGKTIEEAIENFDSEIGMMSSDKWDTWSDNWDGKDREYWIDEYNKWQEENGGDVDITVINDRDNAQGYYGRVTISNTDEY